MKTASRGVWIGFGSLFAVLFLSAFMTDALSAGSKEYPNRTVTIIVPYPPGGGTDLTARALAEGFQKHLKQPFVVVNKVGGATTVGGYAVASAKTDGYTLGFFPPAATIPEAYTYFQEAPYSSRDIKPISGLQPPIQSVAVKDDAPWQSLKELVEYARNNPGIKVSTGGKQTTPHMFLAILNRFEKTGFVGIPFAGDPPNLAALMGGHVSVGILDYSAMRSLVEAKKLRLLAVVTSEKRIDYIPTVPTGIELGYRIPYWPINGLVGPKDLPQEIVETLDHTVAKICTEQDFQAKIRNMTVQIDYQNSASYERTLAKFKESVMAFFKQEGLVK